MGNHTQHFDSFPIVAYEVDGQLLDLRDITRRIQVILTDANNDFVTGDYQVQEGETPQSLAQDFWGDPTLDWLILATNNIIHPFYDWPMGVNELTQWLQDNFQNPDAAYLYILPDGTQYFNDQTAYLQSLGKLTSATTYSYRDYYSAVNDAKRMIRVIRSENIPMVLSRFRAIIQQ